MAFRCNICGQFNALEHFATEPASCSCGSNVRVRALMHLLSLELFGDSLIVAEFPKLKSIRGLGMSDKECYADILAEKFDYTNTFYDRDPRLDFTEAHPSLAGSYDFILSADVLEHIEPPVERALEEVSRLLKPQGFFCVTVYCNANDEMREHFPDLNEYRIITLGGSPVLVNRRDDGSIEIHENLVFHGGTGATLKFREFGISALRSKLQAAGFKNVEILTHDIGGMGIAFDSDVSQPLIARKEPFCLSPCARTELVRHWNSAQQDAGRERERAQVLAKQLALTAQSRWLRLGRKFGFGPDLTS